MQATTAFPQCVLANWATEFLLKTGDTPWKLQSHCGDQSAWCALTLNALNACAPTENKSDDTEDNFTSNQSRCLITCLHFTQKFS